MSETKQSGDSNCSDDLNPYSPCLYDSILNSLQDDNIEDIPGLTDAYNSEESLDELLDVLKCEACDDLSTEILF